MINSNYFLGMASQSHDESEKDKQKNDSNIYDFYGQPNEPTNNSSANIDETTNANLSVETEQTTVKSDYVWYTDDPYIMIRPKDSNTALLSQYKNNS